MNPYGEAITARFMMMDPIFRSAMSRVTQKVNFGMLGINDPDVLLALSEVRRFIPDNGQNFSNAIAQFNGVAMRANNGDLDGDGLFTFGSDILPILYS